MDAVAVVRISGPLTRYVEGFAAELRAQGYTELSLANQLRLLADLSRWLSRKKITVDEIDRAVVDRFLAKRHRTHTHFTSERAMRPLLAHLAAVGAVVVELVVIEQPRSELLREYERYLVDERGVTPGVRDRYLAVAGEFLNDRESSSLTARDVTRYVSAHANVSWFESWLSALRSVLRFLFVAGMTETNLVFAVPSTPRWAQAALPQALEPDELAAVLRSEEHTSELQSRVDIS